MVAYALNSQEVSPQYGSGGSLPEGKYKVAIVSEEQKPTKAGTGGYLQFNIQVIEGQFQGQKTVDRLNLWNPNAQAVDIANKQLSAYCHVTGQFVLADTMQLHNRPFMIEIKKKADSEYTEIAKLFDINGNEPGKPGSAPVSQAPVAPPVAPPPQQQYQPPAQPPQGGWQPPQQQAPQEAPQQGWQPPTQPQQPAPQSGWQPPQGGNPAMGQAPDWARS